MSHISRRSLFAAAAGLIVAFSLPRTADASQATVAADSVDGYLAIAPDGSVTVFAGKVDLGTGARAAIRQIVAEELGFAPTRIALVEGDTALTPDQGSTGGSTGIMVGGMQIRQAAATARAHLIALAAAELQRPADDLDTRDGAVVRPRRRRNRRIRRADRRRAVRPGRGQGSAAARSLHLYDRRHAPTRAPTCRRS